MWLFRLSDVTMLTTGHQQPTARAYGITIASRNAPSSAGPLPALGKHKLFHCSDLGCPRGNAPTGDAWWHQSCCCRNVRCIKSTFNPEILLYRKPVVEKFGSFRQLTQLGFNSSSDGASIFATIDGSNCYTEGDKMICPITSEPSAS